MRTIEIGLEVHKAIEAGRQSLDEPENEILMRLLRLDRAEPADGPGGPTAGRAWRKGRVELPDGTEIEATYAGQHVRGVIRNGEWVVAGRPFPSPSAALMGSVKTRDGRAVHLNGWMLWRVKRPGDVSFRRLDALRS